MASLPPPLTGVSGMTLALRLWSRVEVYTNSPASVRPPEMRQGGMPRKSTIRLNKRVVDGLAVDHGDRVFYDQDLIGFGVRVHESGRKVYVVRGACARAGRQPETRLDRPALRAAQF